MSRSTFFFNILCILLSPIAAQTWTSCNPMNSTDCPEDEALGTTATFNFNTTTDTKIWNTTAGTINYGSSGAEFTIAKKGDSPTIQSEFYFFFGSVEVHMKAAPGQGVISSIVLESDDLDEVDWEVIGGNTTTIETNYFGKGNTTTYDRAIYYPVDNPQENFHNYTVDWTAERIEWYIDSVLVRTLLYADANGGDNFPQTPMNLRMGIWAGGDPGESEGTIEWAGGAINYDNCPYTMYVESAKVTDYSTGAAYKYGDETGSWQSIQIINGTSAISKEVNKVPTPSLSDRFSALSSTTKLAIYCVAGAVGAILMSLIACCCVKQRRAGRRENMQDQQNWNNERKEVEEYQMQMKNGGFSTGSYMHE